MQKTTDRGISNDPSVRSFHTSVSIFTTNLWRTGMFSKTLFTATHHSMANLNMIVSLSILIQSPMHACSLCSDVFWILALLKTLLLCNTSSPASGYQIHYGIIAGSMKRRTMHLYCSNMLPEHAI